MAANINIRVASPVSSGSTASAIDLFNAMKQQAPSLVPDPRADIMRTVQSVPQVQPNPEVERGIPQMLGGATIENMQDVADISGSRFPPQAEREVVLDDNGMPVIDPLTGEKQYKEIAPQDYNQQLQVEQEAQFDPSGPVQAIASGDFEGGQRALFEEQERAASNQWGISARDAHKLNTRLKDMHDYIQTSQTDLQQAIAIGEDAVFGGPTYDASRATIKVDGHEMPAGIKVMADAGLSSVEDQRVLATLSTLAFNQAVVQAGVHKEEKNNGRSRRDETASDNAQVEGIKDYQSNMINATRSALSNALGKMNIKLGDGGVDLLAKAMVQHNIATGALIKSTDKNGRVVLEAAPDMKRQAMNLQRISEAVTGEVKRRGASSTPTHSGATFSEGRPKTTAGAITGDDVVTTTAELVKSILGATANVFRKKDVARKNIELQMIFSDEYVQMIDNQFAWSTHPFAKRNNLHKGAFDAAKHRVERDKSFIPGDPKHEAAFAKLQEQGALQVMAELKALAEFDMQNVQRAGLGALYSQWIHSTSNQRFYPNSYNTDYMGSKNIIRDVLALADQDTVVAGDLFNEKSINRIKELAKTLKGGGVAVQERIEALSPNDLGAIGAMRNAVMYYYTALEPSGPNVVKMLPADVVQLYTPQIGARLAELGRHYNAYLADPTITPDNEMMALWAATEKGEALGTLNLWDDFFKAQTMSKIPATERHSFALTHHAISDGNQNGIFLQSLFYGLKGSRDSATNIARLYSPNPNMDDMRVFGMDTMMANLRDMLHDDEGKSKGWASFWKEAIDKHPDGMAGVSKDFFKKPLMQNAYGKDASMFTDVLMEMIEADEFYAALGDKYLFGSGGPYVSSIEAGTDLSSAVEISLRKLIDSGSVNMMKNIGRFSAVLNQPIKLPGITNDTLAISPVGSAPVNLSAGGGSLSRVKAADGSEVLIKTPSYLSDVFIDPNTGEQTELPTHRVGTIPAASRGTQYFWNRKTQQWDEFHNALGTMQSRQFAVLMIQALDGDLVKMTTVEANKRRIGGSKKKNPWPVMFVHDSIIGTAGSSLLYDHVYNNVAIPAAIPAMASMGMRIQQAIHKMEHDEKSRVVNRGEPVSIGAVGEYPALGAIFDEIFERCIVLGKPEDYKVGSTKMPNDYKASFLRRERTKQAARKKEQRGPMSREKQYAAYLNQSEQHFEQSPEGKWEQKLANMQSVLEDAKKLGWVHPGDMPNAQRDMMAIPANNFPKMVDLAAEYLRMGDMKPWTNDFKQRVTNAWNNLGLIQRNYGGGLQMGAGGGKSADKKGYNPVPIPEADRNKQRNVLSKPETPPVPTDNGFDQAMPF